jgi:succinate-semialdehyde dehydrogenase/glutarate-semialdehyde dehydrogenase
VLGHLEELAEIVTLESGKPLAEARSEVRYGAGFIEWFAEEGKRAYGEVIPSHHSGKRLLTLRQPVGTCAAITPWNFPVAMITREVAPALAAGCSMVVKPAEATPLSALFLETLAHRAGISVSLFAVAPTIDPAMAGRVFCTHPLVRKLSFTGSTRVGKILTTQSAHQITRLSLELGGNAPFIVFDDADLDVAADATMMAKFRNAGQTCVCANRIMVQNSVHDAFVEKLVARVARLRWSLVPKSVAAERGWVALSSPRPCWPGCMLECRSSSRKFSSRWRRSCASPTRPMRSRWPTAPRSAWPLICSRATSGASGA